MMSHILVSMVVRKLTIFFQAKLPSAAAQWRCTKLVLLTHFTVELPQIWYALCPLIYYSIFQDLTKLL